MRLLLTATLLAGLVAVPAVAQRGVPARHAGGFSTPHGFAPPHFGGGFGSSPHFSPAPIMPRRNFGAPPQYRWSMPARFSGSRPLYMPNHSRYSPAPPDRYRGRRPYRQHRYRQPYVPYFYANSTYLVPGLLNADWDYPDNWDSGDQSAPVQQAQAENNNADYGPEPAPYQPQQAQDVPPPPPPLATADTIPQAAVTLVYKDGRSQQIHNYAMTNTTLYVLDDASSGRRPEISLDQIDVAATEKANREAGVDFAVPSGSK